MALLAANGRFSSRAAQRDACMLAGVFSTCAIALERNFASASRHPGDEARRAANAPPLRPG